MTWHEQFWCWKCHPDHPCSLWSDFTPTRCIAGPEYGMNIEIAEWRRSPPTEKDGYLGG